VQDYIRRAAVSDAGVVADKVWAGCEMRARIDLRRGAGMKKTYVACMAWPDGLEPVCVGTNKRKITREAVRMLRAEYGSGDVTRYGALCSCPIVAGDIECVEVGVVL